MWIQESRGRLRLCERYTDMDGKVHRVSVPLVKDSPKERKAAYIELMEKIKVSNSGGAEIRYDELVKKYVERPDIKDSTKSTYRTTYKPIGEIIGNPLVSNITTTFIKRKLSDCDKCPQTKNRYVHALNNLLKFGMEFGYCSDFLHIKPYNIRKVESIEDKYLTSEELAAVLDQMEGTVYFWFTKFMALTGCRIGEAAALRLDDVDGDYIRINKTAWNGRVQTAKTEASEREVFIQDELRAMLMEYMKWRNIHMFAYGIRTDLLFMNQWGNMISAPVYDRYVKTIQSDKRLHAHIFRHTHASLLAESGYSLEAISRRLGHSNSDITKKIYLHITEKMKKTDEEKLNQIRLIN